MLFKVFKLEGSQEPERAEMEGHHRRDGLLEERGGVEEGPVSAETDYEVDLVRQIVLLFVERHQLVAHLKKGHEMMKKRSRNDEKKVTNRDRYCHGLSKIFKLEDPNM